MHTGKGHCQHQWNGSRYHQAGPHSQRNKGDGQHDKHRFGEHAEKSADRLFHHRRLIGNLGHLYAVRQLRTLLTHARAQRLAERQHVSGGRHGNGQADCRLAVNAKQRSRRLRHPARHRGDIGKRHIAPVEAQRHRAQARFIAEGAADAQGDIILRRAHRPCWRHHILRAQGVRNLLQIQPH